MKKNLLLYIILGFLIIMNGFFLLKHFGMLDKTGSPRPVQASFIAEQLEFDTAQLQKFEKLDRTHREKLNTLRGDISASVGVLVDMVSDESIHDSEIEAVTVQIANKEKAKARETFRFFKAVSELCNADQRERFKQIIKDGLRSQDSPGGNRPQEGRGGEHRPPPRPRN